MEVAELGLSGGADKIASFSVPGAAEDSLKKSVKTAQALSGIALPATVETSEERSGYEHKSDWPVDRDVADKTPAKSEDLEDLLQAYWAGVQQRVKSPRDIDPLGPEKDEVDAISIQYLEADQARYAPKLFKLLYPDRDAKKVIELYQEMTRVHRQAQEVLDEQSSKC